MTEYRRYISFMANKTYKVIVSVVITIFLTIGVHNQINAKMLMMTDGGTIIQSEEIAEVEESMTEYDIKLSKELQKYLYDKCIENGLEYELMLAVIRTESNFKSNLISSTNDYGLMQINKCNHKNLKQKLGITDFLNPYQSIDAGVYMLSNLSSKYKDEHQVLTAYNWGEYGMLRGWKKGTRSSKYSRRVLQYREQLIKNGGF